VQIGSSKAKANISINQKVIVCVEEDKFKICCDILERHKSEKVIIFCETKLRVDSLFACLAKEKVKAAEAIHGDKS